jgi:D-glycero-beta-D-manno-heptose-7-phosphate kinase
MKPKIDIARIKKIIGKFKQKNILVVGDLILDHYVFGKVERISPEAPVPVVRAHRENFVCGGSANVGLNLVSLGSRSSICGVVGRDHFGNLLMGLIEKGGIGTSLLVREQIRPTTLKTRIIAQHQQVVRLDWESVEPLSLDLDKRLLAQIKKQISKFDAVIIEDYGKGVINSSFIGDLVKLCTEKNKIVTVDPKEEHFDLYQNVTSLTPNLKEAQNAVHMKIKSKEEIPLLGEMILKKLHPASLLITLGEDGMMLFADGKTHHIPTAALEVFDVTGAGDTVIATFTLALSCGASFYEASVIANFAASIVVGKLGAATTTPEELIKIINA